VTGISPPNRNPSTKVSKNLNWSNQMNLMNEELARAHMCARLGEAQQLREAKMARARRLSLKAERAAQQARLALARAL
jgi:hypothetical protein